MAVRSAGRSRERVVVFGPEATGKSLCALDIAAHLADGAVLYVVDNDNAWDRMLEGGTLDGTKIGVLTEWRWDGARYVEHAAWAVSGGNVVVYHTGGGGWVANVAAIKAVSEVAGRDDWCCVDSGSALWDDVQAWFTETVFSTDLADYFLEVRKKKAQADKEAKALGALDGWVDWPVINAQYKGNVMKFLVNPPCHLIVTAEQAEVTKEDTDKETRTLYGADVKPRGQKRLGHNVQTVLRLRREQNGNHAVWTVKDRGGREKLVREDVTDRGFVDWYLRDVAGWVDDEDVEEQVVVSVTKKVAAVVKKGSA